jgi:hypothetical protein
MDFLKKCIYDFAGWTIRERTLQKYSNYFLEYLKLIYFPN